MAGAAYIIGTVVTLLCAMLLARGYAHSRQRLLLWSSICFFGLTIGNALIYIDVIMLPKTDLRPLRYVTGAASMLLLVFGLIWEGE